MIRIKDLKPYICERDTSIREVLKRIDSSPYLFQMVLDDHGRLLGTITDGDIRRAILQGTGLEDVASNCMQNSPVVGRYGQFEDNKIRLSNLGSSRPLLPVVDAEGVVKEILAINIGDGLGHAFIMAGGAGKRLGERTRNTPKPLLNVGGEPILEHILKSLEEAGVERITVAAHYLFEQIEDFVAKRHSACPIDVLIEPKPLGTAGALGLLYERAPESHLLVVNGDLMTNVDFAAFHDFHLRHGLESTIGVASYNIDLPFGVVRRDADGLFDAIVEKPRIQNFIAAGVYLLSRAHINLVTPGEYKDMPVLLNEGKAAGLKSGLFPIHEYWKDVGRPDDLEAADADHSPTSHKEKN